MCHWLLGLFGARDDAMVLRALIKINQLQWQGARRPCVAFSPTADRPAWTFAALYAPLAFARVSCCDRTSRRTAKCGWIATCK
jgi:hypothetical protein